MYKTIENTFELCFAITATFLQINLLGVGITDAIILKFVVFGGAATYVFRASKDAKLSTKDAFFSALIGYTFGIYAAPAICEYWEIKALSAYTGIIYYLSGVFGMWILSIGWAVMKGAQTDGWGLIKGIIKRKTANGNQNNTNDKDSQ